MTTQKKLIILLIASLAINLFALGLGAGMWLQKDKPHRPPFKELNTREFERLPAKFRHQNREQFQKHRLTIRKNYKAIRAIREELISQITQEALDKKKIKQLLDQIQEHQIDNINLSQEAMLQTLMNMPLEMRKQYAQRLMGPQRPQR